MNSRPLTLSLLALIIFICAANGVADYWHLYHYIWWLDIPMHILGGIWVALTALLIYYTSSRIQERDRSVHFVFAYAIASVFLVGFMWEIYEWSVAHLVMISNDGVFDVLKDFFDDLLGALLGALIFIGKGFHKSL